MTNMAFISLKSNPIFQFKWIEVSFKILIAIYKADASINMHEDIIV